MRILVFKGDSNWFAQCLEYDFAAQAAELDDLPARFAKMMGAERWMAERMGRQPFE